jgi:Mce-associated membrane protein
MSGQTPRPTRRRIAGERRPVRTDEPTPTGWVEEDDAPVETAEPAEPTTDEPPAPPPTTSTKAERTPGPGPSWLVITILGGLAGLLVAGAAVLGLGVWNVSDVREQDAVAEASRNAPVAAERASAAILSYGYESLDADQKAAERYMTAKYKKKYDDTFTRLVRPNAAKVKAKVEAEVKASGVVHADPDRVNVLLYVNQTTTSTANGGEPQVALNRVQLSMVHQDGKWLVDDITSY